MNPVMSILPVRQTLGSASVDSHGSSSEREILSIGQGLHIAPMSRPLEGSALNINCAQSSYLGVGADNW
jgi:hypothetical protein